MSLQLVLGSSGSGKSTYMLNDVIKRSIGNLQSQYIIIVPEQFTMETQKNIVNSHPNGGSLNIDIQSFMRLATNVFEEQGVRTGTVLDDTGKTLVLRKVIEHEKDKLNVFSTKIGKKGFVEDIKSVISEFYQYGIDRDELGTMINSRNISPLLSSKLSDIRAVFEAFEKYIGKEYIPSEEILKLLCDYVPYSNIVKNSEFYLDGFTGFTPIQYKLLEQLMKYSKRVIISLTLPSYKANDTKQLEQDLFLMSVKTKNRLIKIAGDQGIDIEKMIIMKDDVPVRYKKSDALAYLERNIFRYNHGSFNKRQKDVSIYAAGNIESEMSHVVNVIKELVRERGYRYRDIAIVTGNMEAYHRIAAKQLNDGKIPCFMDHKRSIISNPFVEGIRSVIEIITEDFSYESVFRFLKTGMSGIDPDDVDIIENAVLATGIRGYRTWSRQWNKVNENVNAIREKIVDIFPASLVELKIGNYDVRTITTRLYELIISLNMEKLLDDYVVMFEEQNNMAGVKEYSQTYKMVMELLNKIVELMGNERITLSEYAEILDAGFEEIKVGIIPPGIDCVVVGDIQRTRLNNVRAVFFVGVNDGVIPKSGNHGGVLTESDRRVLKDMDIELSPGVRENAFIQKFYLYLNMTKPKEKLYISYAAINNDGKPLRPSYLINEVQKLFTQSIIIDDDGDSLAFLSNESSLMQYIADSIRSIDFAESVDDIDSTFAQLFAYYYGNEKYHDMVENMLVASEYKYTNGQIDAAVAKALYGKEMNNSISRLEKYAACAYSHFLQYGLNLKERKLFEIKVSDLGTLYHSAIEIFSNEVTQHYSWKTLSEETRRMLVIQSVDKAVEENDTEAFGDTARSRYMLQRVRNMTDKTTSILCRQVSKGEFEPAYFEMQFSPAKGATSMRMKLNEESIMNLRGVIDRVDICRESNTATGVDKIYVKIIDYKSGHKDFDINAVYDGRQLQLSMYMLAAIDMLKQKYPHADIIPAAEFYYQIKDPYIDKYNDKGIDDSEIRREIEHHMPGLVNNDAHVLELIDTDIAEKGSSSVIDIGKKTNGEYKLKNSTSTQGFQKLEEYMEIKASSMGKNIIEGDVAAVPCRKGISKPCDYCEFKSICRFDISVDGYNYKEATKLKSEEVWEEIIGCAKEVDEDGE